ncbi:MAG: hypothetical protein V3U39_03830, partial [Acidimicrobiia bacterium]
LLKLLTHFFEPTTAEGASALVFCEGVDDLFDREVWLRPGPVSAFGGRCVLRKRLPDGSLRSALRVLHPRGCQ